VDDEDAEEFCRRVSPRLVGSLLLQCEQRQVAEDIAQEALARAWERWDAVSEMASPEGWVFRVAFNLVSSQRRRTRAERRAASRLASKASPAHSSSDDRLVLREVLAALPLRQRQAIVLRHYAQLSVSETAEVMQCAQGTVKALTSQGISSLRRSRPDVVERDPATEVVPDA
jgi:RNA polymerase sigma-70 factor (ECF subfamily)